MFIYTISPSANITLIAHGTTGFLFWMEHFMQNIYIFLNKSGNGEFFFLPRIDVTICGTRCFYHGLSHYFKLFYIHKNSILEFHVKTQEIFDCLVFFATLKNKLKFLSACCWNYFSEDLVLFVFRLGDSIILIWEIVFFYASLRSVQVGCITPRNLHYGKKN